MSIQITNKEIISLKYNNKTIKKAYYNGKQVWTYKHLVNFFDDKNNLIDKQYVEHGKNANDFIAPILSDTYYTYKFSGWDKSLSNITEDTDIHATSTIQTAYLFKNEKGLNPDYYLKADINSKCYDGTSAMYYTSVTRGSVNNTNIKCTHKGSKSSSNTLFRAMRYITFPILNMETLNNSGYTKLKLSGTYSFGSGTVYREANLRVAFACLQTTTEITTKTSDGVQGNYKYQIKLHVNTTSSTSVSSSSGTFNGEIILPTEGEYYLIIGELTKAFEGTSTLTIDNIWLE